MSRLVKTVSDSDGSRMDAGRLFHTRGPSTAKDRSPNVVMVSGTSSLIVDDDDLRPDRRGQIRCPLVSNVLVQLVAEIKPQNT